MSRLRVGVIGAGRAARDLHLAALARMDDAESVALADPDREALDDAADSFGVEHRSTDYRELLADDGIDAICIAAPSDLHAEIGLAALDAGKHLFVEKPLALSIEDCDRLVERAATAGVRTMVGYNLRFHRHVRRARELIQGGALGDPTLLTTTWASGSLIGEIPPWRADPSHGGGVLAMQAVHHLDLWRYL